MCMAVGKVSLLLWLRFTWSFGWTGFLLPSSPPAISMARFAITSFTFMFDWVPEPVCQTTSGKCASSSPSMTSSAALAISSAISGSRLPRSRLVSAAAFLRMPNARMISRGMRSPPIGKFILERAVCAP